MFWWYHSVFLVSPSDLRGLSSIFICFGCVVVVTVALGVAACQPVSPVPATCAPPLYSLLSIFLEIFLYKVNEWMQFSVRPPQSDSAPIEPGKFCPVLWNMQEGSVDKCHSPVETLKQFDLWSISWPHADHCSIISEPWFDLNYLNQLLCFNNLIILQLNIYAFISHVCEATN